MKSDPHAIDELVRRSVDVIYPSERALRDLLGSGKKLRVYTGIDPTAPHLHLGHSTNIFLLERFRRLGHKAIVLIGDFTAQLGDPSDKSSARPQLTHTAVKENFASFRDQIGKMLDRGNEENPIEFRFNSEWLSGLDFAKVSELASFFTVQQMIERDVFRRRLADQKPLYINEFLYPLLQGYDSVSLSADIEIGGRDQTFNMLAGRTLVKEYQNREKIVLTTRLLEHPKTGEKLMSKSKGTGVSGADLPDLLYGTIMALPDELLPQLFEDCTNVSRDEVADFTSELKKSNDYFSGKQRLATTVVALYHGHDAARKAREHFIETFSKRKIPADAPEIFASFGSPLGDTLVLAGALSSNAVWGRLVSEGAIEIREQGAGELSRLSDRKYKIETPLVIRVGKKKFFRINLK